jgi:hypothetical protein
MKYVIIVCVGIGISPLRNSALADFLINISGD